METTSLEDGEAEVPELDARINPVLFRSDSERTGRGSIFFPTEAGLGPRRGAGGADHQATAGAGRAGRGGGSSSTAQGEAALHDRGRPPARRVGVGVLRPRRQAPGAAARNKLLYDVVRWRHHALSCAGALSWRRRRLSSIGGGAERLRSR